MSVSLKRPLTNVLARTLAHYATHSFGLMGNGNAHLIDHLSRAGVEYTAVRHEAATVASADAYYRVSGKLAIATTTYGAGFTNTLTALAEAVQARIPMLVVVGDEPSGGPRPWDVDQEKLAEALGVPTYTLTAHGVAEVVTQAVMEAFTSRTPVVIGIPYDLVATEVEDLTVGLPDISVPSPEPDAASVHTAVELLTQSQRPVVLAGVGAWRAGAGEALNEMVQRLQAVTASTPPGRGVFTDDTVHLGITGGFGEEGAMARIAEADVVLVVGAGLNQFTMRFGELFGEGTMVIRVDIDEVAPPKTKHALTHHLVQGDAKVALEALLTALGAERPNRAWRDEVAQDIDEGRIRVPEVGASREGTCDDGRLDPRHVAKRIGELLPEDIHITSDGGHFIGWANMFWPVTSPERLSMVGTAYQTIGLGFSTVAGIQAGARETSPDTTVVLTTGDGGGLMALADLETAIRTAERLVIVVWNDGAYGAEVHLYGLMGLDDAPMRIPDVNFAGLATALGAHGVVVQRLTDLDSLTEWKDAGGTGTILLDCRISQSVLAPYQREVQRVNGLDV